MTAGGFSVTVDMKPDIKNLPGKLKYEVEKFGSDVLRDVATRTQLSVKLRAPRDTGKLRDSVSLENISKYKMMIWVGRGLERPYAIYQEYGFKGHLVNKELHPEVRKFPGPPGTAAIRTKPSNMDGYYVGPAVKMVPTFIERAADVHWKRGKGFR